MTPATVASALAVLRARLGLVLAPDAEQALRAHLRARAAAAIPPEVVLDELRRLPLDHPGLASLVTTVTNGQTYFLRDERVLETLLEALPKGRPLRVWSAGCSTGEEPYSLALLARERDLDVRIVATDVSTTRLATARAGRYAGWSLRRLGDERRMRHFVPDGDGLRVHADLQRVVDFVPHSLTSGGMPAAERFDAILCRHVLIYLDPAQLEGIATTFARALVRGGLVVLGVAERLPPGEADLEWVTDGDVAAYCKGPPSTDRFHTRVGRSGLTERPSRPSATPPRASTRPSVPSAASPTAPPTSSGVVVRTPDAREDWVADLIAVHRRAPSLDLASAVAAYRVVTEHHGAAAEAWYALGHALLRQGDAVGARDALRSAVFLEPRMWRASLQLGTVYAELGQLDAARRELERTLDVLGTTGLQVRHLAPIPENETCLLTPTEAAAIARARLARLPKVASS